MAVPASLLSLLVRQTLVNAGAWAAKHTHDWLVWEPGTWRVPGNDAAQMTTQLPSTGGPQRPPQGDCLCFELKTTQPKISIGRTPENDISINDATVSRTHLVLERQGTRWVVNVSPASRATMLKVKAALPGTDGPLELSSGDQLTLGGVVLTYLTVDGMKARLKVEAEKLKV